MFHSKRKSKFYNLVKNKNKDNWLDNLIQLLNFKFLGKYKSIFSLVFKICYIWSKILFFQKINLEGVLKCMMLSFFSRLTY